MCAAVATKGDITIKHVIPKHMESISAKLLEMGAQIEESDDAIRVVATKRLQPTNIKTLPYPGFPTGYAVPDRSGVGPGTGNKYYHRKYF